MFIARGCVCREPSNRCIDSQDSGDTPGLSMIHRAPEVKQRVCEATYADSRGWYTLGQLMIVDDSRCKFVNPQEYATSMPQVCQKFMKKGSFDRFFHGQSIGGQELDTLN